MLDNIFTNLICVILIRAQEIDARTPSRGIAIMDRYCTSNYAPREIHFHTIIEESASRLMLIRVLI